MKRWIDLEENEQSYNLLLDYARNGMLEIYEISKQFIPKEYMTKEFFEILVNKNSGYITVTPTEFITNEMATMVVTENGSLIQYIPLEKRTQKICDIAFAYSKKNIKYFPENLVTEKLTESVINEDGYLLGSLPLSVINYELCLKAVFNKGTAIRFVPDKFKTYDLCKIAVISDPRAIRRVPVKFITEDFCKETLSFTNVLPVETKDYVDKCLAINNKSSLNRIELKEPNNPIQNNNYTTINIDDTKLFSSEALRRLKDLGIISLHDLFQKSSEPDFAINIQTQTLYKEIIGTTKLLKCKYLNEDPLINLSEVEYDELGEKLGLSTRATKALKRYHISGQGLIDIMTSMDINKFLGRIRNIGKETLEEITNKYYIVSSYYKNKAVKEPDLSDLILELQDLVRMNTDTNNKIAMVVEKIEAIKNQEKGSGLK